MNTLIRTRLEKNYDELVQVFTRSTAPLAAPTSEALVPAMATVLLAAVVMTMLGEIDDSLPEAGRGFN